MPISCPKVVIKKVSHTLLIVKIYVYVLEIHEGFASCFKSETQLH